VTRRSRRPARGEHLLPRASRRRSA